MFRKISTRGQKTNYILILCILGLIGLMMLSCSKKEETYQLGVMTNLEGKNSQSSIDAFNSIKLAYEEFKQEHPKSFNLDIVSIDNSDDPQKTKTAYKTIKKDSDFIIAVTTSTAMLAIYDEMVKQTDILHVVVGPTTTVISGKDDNIIRNGIDMTIEQKSIADFFTQRNVEKILVIQENEKNEQYTSAAFQVFSQFYRGAIVHTAFSAVTVDLTETLRTLQAEDFQYVYILAGGTPREVGIAIQSIHKINPEIYTVTTPWVRGPFLIEAIGQYTDRVLVPGHISTKNAEYLKYADKFYQKYNYQPAYQAPLTYDAAKILFAAIFKSDDRKVESVKKEIVSHTFIGTTDDIIFNQYGDVDGRLYFYQINKDNAYETLE